MKTKYISNIMTVWFRASDGWVYGPPPNEIKAILTMKEKIVDNEKVKEFNLTWTSLFWPVICDFKTFKESLNYIDDK